MCWSHLPGDRPSFSIIAEQIQKVAEGILGGELCIKLLELPKNVVEDADHALEFEDRAGRNSMEQLSSVCTPPVSLTHSFLEMSGRRSSQPPPFQKSLRASESEGKSSIGYIMFEGELGQGSGPFRTRSRLVIPAVNELWLTSDDGELVVVDTQNASVIYRKIVHSSRIPWMFSVGDCVWCFSEDGFIIVLNQSELTITAYWKAVKDTVSPIAMTKTHMWMNCPITGRVLLFKIRKYQRLLSDNEHRAFHQHHTLRTKLESIKPKVYVLTLDKEARFESHKKKVDKAKPADISLMFSFHQEIIIASRQHLVRIDSAKHRIISVAAIVQDSHISTITPQNSTFWVGTHSGSLLSVTRGLGNSTNLTNDLQQEGRIHTIEELSHTSICTITCDGQLMVWDTRDNKVLLELQLPQLAATAFPRGEVVRVLAKLGDRLFVVFSYGRMMVLQNLVSDHDTHTPVSPSTAPESPRGPAANEFTALSEEVIALAWAHLTSAVRNTDPMKQTFLEQLTRKTQVESTQTVLLRMASNAGKLAGLMYCLRTLQSLLAVRLQCRSLRNAKADMDADAALDAAVAPILDHGDNLRAATEEMWRASLESLDLLSIDIVNTL